MDFLPDTGGQKRIKSLLLIYLFVARTLGDCPKPVLVENTVLTNIALLLNEFPDNIEISLECANGYIIESGSGIMKCTAGAWGDPDITCKKKDCGPPPPKPHMTFDLSQGTLFGALALVKCAKGYFVKGLAYKRCYSAGWTAKSTTCQILTCNKPDEVANGRSSWNSDDLPNYGDHIEYFCDEGHTLIGNNTIVCSENGEYDSTPPQCQEERDVDGIVHTKTGVGPIPVIISVVCVVLVVCIILLLMYKLQKRKGSYDTREDLKPELLQFQNL